MMYEDLKILSFDEIVKIITELTDLPEEEVKYRVWIEALNPGINVSLSSIKFGITPHTYDEKMENFYKFTDAFIFELMVESCRIGKREVMNRIKSRIDNYISTRLVDKINILMFGDGVGSDTIFLHENFGDKAKLYYFDIPGSKTFDFAIKRFNKHNIPINIITDIKHIPENFFDIVICLEVLEHLPEPTKLVAEISTYLKNGGVALITESFGAVTNNLPTHLKSNLKYAYRTPFLFLKENMILTYYPIKDLVGRPMEFMKISDIPLTDKLKYKVKLLLSKHIGFQVLKHWIRQNLKKVL